MRPMQTLTECVLTRMPTGLWLCGGVNLSMLLLSCAMRLLDLSKDIEPSGRT